MTADDFSEGGKKHPFEIISSLSLKDNSSGFQPGGFHMTAASGYNTISLWKNATFGSVIKTTLFCLTL